MIVYALIDPRTNCVRYIGKTHRTAHRRLRRHLSTCYLGGETHRERWLRSLVRLGLEPKIEILQECSDAQELCEAERNQIRLFRESGADLTNATAGGDGGCGPHTAESKAKISKALSGRIRSEQQRLRIGLANRGRKATPETLAKLSAIHKSRPRKPLSEDHRNKISAAKGGIPFRDQNGRIYETKKGASRELNIDFRHLDAVLRGERKRVKGFTFTFLTEQELRVREMPQ